MKIPSPTQFLPPTFHTFVSYDSTSVLVGIVATGILTALYYYFRSPLSEKQVDVLKTSGENADSSATDSSFEDFSPSEEDLMTPTTPQTVDPGLIRVPKRYGYPSTSSFNRGPYDVDELDLEPVKKNLFNQADKASSIED